MSAILFRPQCVKDISRHTLVLYLLFVACFKDPRRRLTHGKGGGNKYDGPLLGLGF